MTRHKILTKEELESRCEIFLENYSKKLHIEALTMAEMTRKDVTSSIIAYADAVAAEASHKSAVSLAACMYEKYILTQLDEKESSIYEKLTKLEEDTRTAESLTDVLETARYYHDTILSDMEELRKDVDEAEKLIPEKYLSYPTYGQMLFSLR
jgi:glutamine synthetase